MPTTIIYSWWLVREYGISYMYKDPILEENHGFCDDIYRIGSDSVRYNGPYQQL